MGDDQALDAQAASQAKPAPPPEQVFTDPEWVRLVQASDGKKKISTTVDTKAAEKFSRSLSLVQMASMDGLQEIKKPSKKERAKGSTKKA